MKIVRVIWLSFCLVSTYLYFGLMSLGISGGVMSLSQEETPFMDTICKKTSLQYLEEEDKRIAKRICKNGSVDTHNQEHHFFYRKMYHKKNAIKFIKNLISGMCVYLLIAFLSNRYVNKFHNYWLYACFAYAIIMTSYYIWEVLKMAHTLI